MNGKCPKCEKILNNVRIALVDCKEGLAGRSWRGVSYACPFCNTILSVQIDPIAIKTDIVAEIKRG